MKIINCLLLAGLLYLFNCRENSNTEQDTEDHTIEEVQNPELWLEFKGQEGSKNIVLVSGDEEYRSEEVLPQMARILSKHHGFNCTVLFAQDPEKPGIVNPNYTKNIPGLENLATADLMIIFTRFRALPDDQMQMIDDYLKSGKPVLGIRTATHAFKFEEDYTGKWAHYGNYYEGDKEAWIDGFGRLVLGEKWISHHGHHKHQSTRGIFAENAASHPITNGIEDEAIWGPTDVYGVRLPLPADSQPIILGQVINRDGEYKEKDIFFGMHPEDTEVASTNTAEKDNTTNPNDPIMPVAWVKSYQIPDGQRGKTFATTLGASSDFIQEATRRMFINASFWLLDMPVPEKANVDIVGKYTPSQFAFHDDEYWTNLNLKLIDIKALDE